MINDFFTFETYASLIAIYNCKSRHYHNINHIHDCLTKIQGLPSFSFSEKEKKLLSLAAWMHDLVYIPGDPDNEINSAGMCYELFRNGKIQRIGSDDLLEVSNIISSTKDHLNLSDSKLVNIFLDIDMSILGESEEKYKEYVRTIKKEYCNINQNVFQHGRRQFLTRLLNSERIFKTDIFFISHETQARENIKQELGI